MTSTNSQSKKKGFTIIEVLIVLALAGLILLVVFLAVPALQRNSRNTQRTTDAGNILSAMNEYVGNNNGRLPADQTNGSGSGSTMVIGADGSNKIEVNLGYYDAGDVDIVEYGGGNDSNSTDTDTIVIMKGAACSTSENAVGQPIDGSTRSVVILYTLEGSGDGSKQCRQS